LTETYKIVSIYMSSFFSLLFPLHFLLVGSEVGNILFSCAGYVVALVLNS